MMLTYVRKAQNGKLIYFYWDGTYGHWKEFDSTVQAFDFACRNGIDFLHQPWSVEVEDRIMEALGLQQGRTLQ